MIEFVLNLIYPSVCGMCERLNKNSLCKKCEKQIRNYTINQIGSYKDKYFDKHIYIFNYNQPIRQKIIDYKFNDKPYLSEFFVKNILNNEKTCKIIKAYDIILPVPIHKKRQKERGYNQSKLIATKLAKELGIEVNCNCLYKNKSTIEQSKLNRLERIENIKNVYDTRDVERINGKNIIIFDDIYTTGSTVNECARILKKAGAKNILVLTIAKD